MNILLAEDDLRLGRLIKHMLEKEKMTVDWVERGDIAFDSAVYSHYDVVILDWMMPGENGLSVCGRLRKQGYKGAILMLTAKDALEDVVLGLDTGADDYIVKPFEFAELLARLRSLFRRSANKLKDEIVEVGNLTLNRTSRVVKRNGREIQLSGREFQMLDLFVQNRGQVVPRQILLERVWGLESEVTPNNLEAYVSHLRKKIDRPDEITLIHTIRGVGYKMEG